MEKKSNIDCDDVITFLGRYRSGDWIYPAALHRTLKMSITDIYEVLELCTEAGLLDPYLDVYCPHCQRFTGYRYKTIIEIPDELNCVNCDALIQTPEQHAIVIYRKQ